MTATVIVIDNIALFCNAVKLYADRECADKRTVRIDATALVAAVASGATHARLAYIPIRKWRKASVAHYNFERAGCDVRDTLPALVSGAIAAMSTAASGRLVFVGGQMKDFMAILRAVPPLWTVDCLCFNRFAERNRACSLSSGVSIRSLDAMLSAFMFVDHGRVGAIIPREADDLDVLAATRTLSPSSAPFVPKRTRPIGFCPSVGIPEAGFGSVCRALF